MKYTFETEDEEEAKNLIQSNDIKVALFTFDQWLRSEIKHGGKNYDEVRDALRDLMNDFNINLD